DLRTGVVESPAYGLDEVAPHDAVGFDPEVRVAVAVRHGLPCDLEDRLVAVVGDESDVLDLAFEQLVRGDGRAVTDRGDRVTARREARTLEYLVDPCHEAIGGVARRRRRLGGDQFTRLLVERD